jgi:drug/metabolite transporter (DMT)-like permease
MSKPIGVPLLAGAFVLSWSSGFIGAKLGTSDAPVLTVLMWRFVPAAALLASALAVRSRPRGRITVRMAGRHVVVGLLSQTAYLLTVYGAIGLGVSTGTTALVDGVQPLVAAAVVGPLLGVAVTGRQSGGLALGLVGVAVVTWADATASSTTASTWAYALPFLGMLGLVASTILERRSTDRVPALTALTVHCATSAVVLTALAVATGVAAPPATPGFWLSTAWLVALPTLGGYGLYWVLVERIGVTAVNSLMFLIAPVTAVWGALMFGEPFTVATAGGLALALVAARLASVNRPRARPSRTAPGAPSCPASRDRSVAASRPR